MLVASILAIVPAAVLAAPSPTGSFSAAPISLDTTSAGGSGAWTSLAGAAGFQGTAGTDIKVGDTIRLVPPAGFEFDPVTATRSNTCTTSEVWSPTTSSITMTLGGVDNSGACVATIGTVRVRPTNTTPTVGNLSLQMNLFSPVSVGTIASVAGAPVHLKFSTQPPNPGAVASPFTTAVAVVDQFGNTVPSAVDSITLAKWSGPGAFGCLSGTNNVPTSGGIASFTGCTVDQPGTYQLRAQSLSFGAAFSDSFFVSAAVATNSYFFTGQPGSAAAANALLTPQPVVDVVDQFHVLQTSFNGTVTLTLASGTSGAILTCTGSGVSNTAFAINTTFPVIAGRANPTGCRVDRTGVYTLQASGPPGAPAAGTSMSFVVGAIVQNLIFTQSPTSLINGFLAPNPVVQVVDGVGSPISARIQVTLSLVTISGSSSAFGCANNPDFTDSLSGSLSFQQCFLTGTGTFQLRATTGGVLPPALSAPFTIGTSSNQVVFTTQPLGAYSGFVPTAPAGQAWTTQPVVSVRNLAGQVLTNDFSTQVSLSITPATPTSGGPGVLSCTNGNTRTVSAGVATFQGCSINTAGTSYRLRATITFSSTVAQGTLTDSFPFTITGAGTGPLVFTTQPLGATVGFVPTGPAATAWTVQPVVAVRNTLGSTITTDNTTVVGLTITPNTPTSGSPGVLSCTGGNTRTVVAGVASFAGCMISTAGTSYQIRASVITSSTVTPGSFTDSLPFTLTAAATTISLTTYPSVVIWGDPFTATIQFTGSGNHAFTLQRLAATDNGVWQNVANGTTDSTGRAVLQYKPRFNGQYKVTFAGDGTAGPGTSNVRTVNVRNLVLLRPEWSGTRTVSVNYTQTYQATVRPVPSGGLQGGVSRVEFQFWRLTNGRWVKVKGIVVPLSPQGVGTLKYTWNSAGQWYIRAVTLPNPYNFTGSSSVQRMNVQ